MLDDLGPEHANEFIRQVADWIGDELTIQHITFALHKYKIAILCYVTDERLLHKIRQEVVAIVTQSEFEVGHGQLTTRVAISASIWESDSLKFDFRKWMTHAEIGLNKDIARDLNCCVLSKGDEADLSQLNTLVVLSSTASVSTGVGVGVNTDTRNPNAHKHQSTLSRFATSSLSPSNLLIGQQGNLGLTT
ncbi:hypothetical protein RFI_35645 [Reticulomyxa filosa]|uniref:Uncharacterized protein n=1 Tax=Reticulomyxa filosa TaxID=46433 RepID=X6LJJ9_RETFI|nr:hypothetical protein RFI_35645 [Reticulomyxa filosa]|eukprot:ETO01794.1 hypothetical protein RFI_35645 [Reticulomyxa filosa]